MIFGRSSHASSMSIIQYASRRSTLHRILGFTGKTIDDVINCPIARRTVLGYYKLHRQVERQAEVSELEKQWNPLG